MSDKEKTNLGQDKRKEDIATFDTQDTTDVFLINGEEEEEEEDSRGPIPQESINIPAFSMSNKSKSEKSEDQLNTDTVQIKLIVEGSSNDRSDC